MREDGEVRRRTITAANSTDEYVREKRDWPPTTPPHGRATGGGLEGGVRARGALRFCGVRPRGRGIHRPPPREDLPRQGRELQRPVALTLVPKKEPGT